MKFLVASDFFGKLIIKYLGYEAYKMNTKMTLYSFYLTRCINESIMFPDTQLPSKNYVLNFYPSSSVILKMNTSEAGYNS